jgi:hypothetical protein
MTPDGQETVLTGNCGGIEVTRRIRIDPASSTARLVETFANIGPRDLGHVDVTLAASVRLLSGYFSDTGATNPATLDPHASGLVAFTRLGNNPGIAWWLATPRSRSKPASIRQQPNRFIQITYRVPLPRGAKVSILHGFGQFMPSQPNGMFPHVATADPKTLATYMSVCDANKWAHDLPRDLRRTLMNFTPSASAVQGQGVLPSSLAELLDLAGLERGEQDVLAVDDESSLRGTAQCQSLSLTSARGKAELDLEDVAAIRGGGGRGRPSVVYLRDGEVLVGELAADGFFLTTDEGLKADLMPEFMNLLALHVSPADHRPADGVAALVATSQGDRLAVRSDPKQNLTVATAWGAATVPWDTVEWLAYEQQPQPAFRVAFRDHTRLTALVVGPAVELDTERWGKVSLAPRDLRRWDSIESSRALADPEPDDPGEDEELQVPHVRLAGGNVLAAQLADRELHLITAAGERVVQPARIKELVRNDDGSVRCQLVEGGTLVGNLQESRLTVPWQGQQFRVPLKQVISLSGAPARPVPESAADE